ncbi:MAG: FimV/HubP family polar landmark protein [Pseudomonadota bacterium]
MKLNILARGLALTIVIFPGVVFSLGLGEIDVISALNQPLRAEIKLLSVRHNEIEDLRVTLAPTEAFKRIGIDRPFVLSQLKFNPIVSSSGQTVIQITTAEPVREPFLNFLVEVQWPRGQLLREYTILLDPPVFTEEQHSVGVQPPVAGTNSKKSINNNQARAVHQNSAAGKGGESSIDQQGPQSSFPVQGQSHLEQSADTTSSQQSQTYKTKRGDTLSGIAQDLRPNEEIGLSEMMIALLRANPQAFLRDNINELMAGVILRMPTSAELASIDRAQAINDVASHNALWREYRSKVASSAPAQLTGPAGKGMISHNPADGSGESSGQIDQGNDLQQGNLEILVADSSAGSQETISTGNEINSAALHNDLALAQELAESRLRQNEQLKSKVQDLEDMLERQERLINLQSDELSDLQQRLSGEGASPEIKAAVDLEGIEEDVGTAIEAEGFKSTDGVVQADIELGSDDGSEMVDTEGLDIELLDTELLEGEEQLLSDQTEATEPEQIESVVVEDSPISVEPDASVENETKEQFASITSSIGSLIDDLMAKPIALATIAGTGLLLMLFLLWKVVPRGRKGTDGSADQSAALSEEIPEQSAMAAVSDSRQASREDDKIPVEDPSHAGESQQAEPAGEATSKQGASAPGTVAQAGLSTGGDEKDETLTEAEVYIAYGLHQQAEELLKDAIEKRPERDDYRLKLLEAYYGDQNREAFDTLAGEIHDRQGADADPWERVLTMGRELNPNNPLYGSSVADDSVAPAAGSSDEFGHHEDETLIRERPQDLNFDETEIIGLPGESSVQDFGSGYTSDIVQELDSNGVTDQDAQLDEQISEQVELDQEDGNVDSSVLEQDGSILEFDISELQLDLEEELEESDSQSHETGLSYDETIDFETSDLDLDVITEGFEQESKDHEAVAVDIYPDDLELDADESLTSAGLDISFQPDGVDDQEKDVAEGGTDGDLPTEFYASELDDELTILGGDLDLDSEIDAESEAIDTAAEPNESVDEISVEGDEAEIDLMQLDLDDLDTGISQEAPEVGELRFEEETPAEGMSTELYTQDLDDESMMVGNDLDSRTTTDDLDEVSAITEEPLLPVDEALTEVYDPKMDSGEGLDLVDLDVDSSPDNLGAGSAAAHDHEAVDGLDTDVYSPKIDLEASIDDADIETPTALSNMDREVEALDQEPQSVDEVPTTLYDPSLDGELDPASVETEHNPDAESTEAQMPTETFSTDQGRDGTDDAEEFETILREIPEDQGALLAGIASDQQVSDVDEALAGALADQDVDETSGSQVFDVLEEVSTKLDLAKAYLDMGDNEGARNALEEVVQDGDGEQRKEAEEMIKQIA